MLVKPFIVEFKIYVANVMGRAPIAIGVAGKLFLFP